MIDIPMKIKSPESLGNMAAAVGRRIRQPQPLYQMMGSIMQPFPRTSSGQFGQTFPGGTPQPRQVPQERGTAQPWQAAEGSRAAEPWQTAQRSGAEQPNQAPQPWQTAQRSGAEQPNQAPQPWQTAQRSGAVQSNQAAQPWQTAQRSGTIQPNQALQPSQTAQPWQTVPGRTLSAGGGMSPGEILRKGQKLSLTRENPGLTEVEASLGWIVQNPACDIDASAFLLGSNGKVVGDEWFVFYGQTSSPDGSVVHHGESRGAEGETLSIDLKKLHPGVKRIVFILTIHEALRQRLNFGMVSDAYIQVRDGTAGKEILRFRLDEYYSNVISMVVGEIYEKNGEWRFHAVGNGVNRDLAGLCELYGVQVE
ncbi:TerD family protein [Lachnospiraceae bacterium 46-15]